MERFKEHINRTVQQLGESFTSEDDVKVLLDDMNDFVLSSYDAPSTSKDFPSPNPVTSSTSTPKKVVIEKEQSKEDEVINSIDAAYFIDHDEFDAIDYELKKLPDIEMCYEDIQRERLRLKSQHNVVSKKISSLIMQKSPSYSGQIGEMEIIKTDLGDVLQSVINIRRSLSISRSQTRTCLGLIANKKKEEMLKTLKKTLITIKSFYESEHSIRETIQASNFPLAIQMLIETQVLAANYAQYSCVNDVMSKLAGMSCLLESELYSALNSLAVVFDNETYNFVYTAFEMLEKTGNLAENLIQSFIHAIETSSRTILCEKTAQNGSSDEPSSFISLSLKLSNDHVMTALREMGFVFCRTFYSFHCILRIHGQEMVNEKSNEIYRKLMENRQRVFTTTTSIIQTVLESRDFASLKFDQILDVVDMINIIENIGRTYFSYSNNDLCKSIERQISEYFARYHRERVDELAMFIENESFALCPVPPQFTIFDLQNFEFLKQTRVENDDEADKSNEFNLIPSIWQNPFSQAAIKSRHQSSKSDGTKSRSYSTTSEGLRTQESLEDPLDPLDPLIASPNLCNTALNLLRFFGKYLRMSTLLPSISEMSTSAIIELYMFFFASICRIFGTGGENVEKSEKLAECLNYIDKSLSQKWSLKREEKSGSPFKIFRNKEENCIKYPSICPAVQIDFIDNLYGSCERIIAIDSIDFVARQLDLIRPVLESLFPKENEKALQDIVDSFYTQVVPCTKDAKIWIIDNAASKSLHFKSLVERITSVKWDIDELQSQHSPYVDSLVRDFECFSLRLNSLKKEMVGVNESMFTIYWERTIYYAFKALVQGYGEGGKCSTEGRALMQLDFQNILIKIESLSGLKPVPHSSFVDGYIKAFYLPETGLEQWIKTHSEYSSKQLTSLLGAAAHVSKKARIRILDALKE